MSTASDLYYTQVAHQLDPIQWEALTPREQAGWEYAAGIADEVRAIIGALRHSQAAKVPTRWIADDLDHILTPTERTDR